MQHRERTLFFQCSLFIWFQLMQSGWSRPGSQKAGTSSCMPNFKHASPCSCTACSRTTSCVSWRGVNSTRPVSATVDCCSTYFGRTKHNNRRPLQIFAFLNANYNYLWTIPIFMCVTWDRGHMTEAEIKSRDPVSSRSYEFDLLLLSWEHLTSEWINKATQATVDMKWNIVAFS